MKKEWLWNTIKIPSEREMSQWLRRKEEYFMPYSWLSQLFDK